MVNKEIQMKVILTLLLLSVGCFAQEKPQQYIDTTMPVRTGIIYMVGPNDNLQTILNSSKYGDDIVIPSDVIKVGNFVLPVKSGTGVVIIRNSDMTSFPEGKRVSPTQSYPKILSPNNDAAIRAASGASGYRLIGLEVGLTAGLTQNGGIIVLGQDETTLAALPSNIAIDRCYIHGNATGNVSRGVTANCKSLAVIDSYISNIHGVGFDTQAICGWNGSGPFKIVNNYLEGSGENVMFGGADPKIANLVPSDIEFRRNTCVKPLSWKVGDPSYAGTKWSVKNLFELKNAQRVLIDGNLFENCWLEAQVGFAVQFTTRNQDGGAPWSVVQDVTFTNNIVRHAAGGINILGHDDLQTAQQTQRIKIVNNLFDDIGGTKWGGNGRLFQLVDGAANITLDHNTGIQTFNILTGDGRPHTSVVYTNNLTPHNDYGVIGGGLGVGNPTITTWLSSPIFKGNVIAGGLERLYPAGNFFPTSLDSVGFVDRASGNYRLKSDSLYKGKATDGSDVGANLDAIATAMNSIPAPNPTPTPLILNLTIPKDGVEFVVRDKSGNIIQIWRLNPQQ